MSNHPKGLPVGPYPPLVDDVEFMESTPPHYVLALARKEALESQNPTREFVICRASHYGTEFYLSCQSLINSGGDELYAKKNEPFASKIGYDIFSAPKGVDPSALLRAIQQICSYGQQPPPTNGGHNAIGQQSPPTNGGHN